MADENRARSVGAHDWHSPDYVDWWIARDESRDTERRQRLRDMLAYAPAGSEAALAVLDVGGGYGVLTEEVLAAFPQARVTLEDYSEPMLAAARRRLAGDAGRMRFVLADLCDPAWTDTVGGGYDLAVSAIAIHNVRDVAVIALVYRGICSVLKPGGVFLDYDLFFDSIGGLARHVELLKEAGFGRVECLWQQGPTATIAAHK